MANNFPQLMTDTKPQIKEVWRTPSSEINNKKHLYLGIFKLQKIKNKEKIFRGPSGGGKTPDL